MPRSLRTVKEYLKLFGRGDFEGAARLMHPEAAVRWPNTREIFLGSGNFIEANKNYPGKWLFKIERIEESGRGVAAAVRVFSRSSRQSFHVVSFFELKAGLIFRITEYWGRDGEPPAWRKRGGWTRRY